MEHITIQPTKVRGQGNVLNPKTLEEYEKISSELGVDEDIFTLIPLFFDLSVYKKSTNDGSTQFYTNTSLTVNASVRYSNSNVIVSDERVTNQNLALYMDGELKFNRNTDSQGTWMQSYDIGKLSEGEHTFQLKFKDSWSQIVHINIKQSVGSISLSRDKSETYLGENITWTATVKDTNNNLVANQPVQFINSTTGEILSTVVSDENGECSFTHSETGLTSALGSRQINIRATCTDVNSNIASGTYWNHNPQTITCELNTNEIVIDDSVTMTVSLLDHFNNKVTGGICIDGASNSEYSIQSQNNNYIITYTPSSAGNKSLKVYLCSNVNIYKNVSVTVNSTNTSLSLTTPEWAKYDSSGSFECSAKLTNTTLSKGVPNASLKIYVNNTLYDTVTTNSTGVATFNVTTTTKQNKNIKVVHTASNGHNSSESSTNTVIVGATLNLNVTITKRES